MFPTRLKSNNETIHLKLPTDFLATANILSDGKEYKFSHFLQYINSGDIPVVPKGSIATIDVRQLGSTWINQSSSTHHMMFQVDINNISSTEMVSFFFSWFGYGVADGEIVDIGSVQQTVRGDGTHNFTFDVPSNVHIFDGWMGFFETTSVPEAKFRKEGLRIRVFIVFIV